MKPNDRFNGEKALTAPDLLFKLTEDVIPVVIENSGDESVTVYNDTTLCTSEVVPKDHIQNVGMSKARGKQETMFDKTKPETCKNSGRQAVVNFSTENVQQVNR